MARIIDIKDFRAEVKAGGSPVGALRFAQPGAPIATAEARTVSFVFSDGSVDRYGDTLNAKGWVLDAFSANPVALFGHDANSVENVIGRAKNVRVQDDMLVGDIEFLEASVNPNAETVYQMVKGGYLNTVSVGFRPMEWTQTKDKSRPGGIDFRKQELMEISIVPVPANPNAVALARSAGIEVDRLALAQRAESRANPRDAAPLIRKKGLYSVSELAAVLCELGWITDSAQWEAEYEGDGSQVPAMLVDAMNKVGEALIAMTVEEVTELLDRFGGATAEKDFTPAQKFVEAMTTAMAAAKHGPSTTRKLDLAIELSTDKVRALIDEKLAGLGVVKAGKTLSAASASIISDACAKMMEAHSGLMAMLEPPEDDTQEPDDAQPSEAEARDMRARKARALQLQTQTRMSVPGH